MSRNLENKEIKTENNTHKKKGKLVKKVWGIKTSMKWNVMKKEKQKPTTERMKYEKKRAKENNKIKIKWREIFFKSIFVNYTNLLNIQFKTPTSDHLIGKCEMLWKQNNLLFHWAVCHWHWHIKIREAEKSNNNNNNNKRMYTYT